MKVKLKARRRAPIRIPKRPELAAPPGTVATAGDAAKAPVDVVRYGPHLFTETKLEDVKTLRGTRPDASISWINVEGVEDTSVLRDLAEIFSWHSLVLEDVISVHQRPKTEDYDDYAYVVLHMPSGPDGLPLEQLNLIFGKNYVVSVQGGAPGDSLNAVRDRIREGRGRIRSAEGDYLAYAIIDAVIDHYFPMVEKLNLRLETLETQLSQTPNEVALADLHGIRNDLHSLWRTITATREAISKLTRGEADCVGEHTRLYLRDSQDHCAQLLDAIAACRELSSSLMELQQSMIGNRMAEGMRILTMIATVFIPMTFVAGVYGMNFNPATSPLNMPELEWFYGYPFALGLMLSVGLGFLYYVRRNG